MTAFEVIRKYLEYNGFDGLYNEYEECGCLLEDDLVPCDGIQKGCTPGYRMDNGDDYDFFIIGQERK